jgi:hypothetical protein
VAWWSDLDIDGPGHIYAATATAAGPLVVDSLAPTDTNVEEHARPAVLAEPGGRALAMWHDDSLSPSPVMLAASDATGHRTRIRRLTSCGETGDLTRWPDGRVLAAWTSCVDDTVVRAQSRTSRGSWGHVRTVHRGDDRNVATSIEPRSGRPVVAWVNYAYHRPHGPDALMVAAGDPRPHPRHGD